MPSVRYDRRMVGVLFFIVLCTLVLAIVALFLPIDSNDPGPAGASGPSGPVGGVGPTGPAGGVGPAGPPGGTGSTGALGSTGATGAAGPQGPQGMVSATGTCGSTLIWNTNTTQWESNNIPKVITWTRSEHPGSMKKRATVANPYHFAGGIQELILSRSTNYTSVSPALWVGQSHVYIQVTVITGSGTFGVTGTRVMTNGVHMPGYTEMINADEISYYQTLATFAEITEIAISGFASVTYQAGPLNYWNQFGFPYQLVGSSAQFDVEDDNNAQFIIQKVNSTSLTNPNKFDLVTIEDYEFKSNNPGNSTFTDNLRMGAQDRSYIRQDGSFSLSNVAIVGNYMDYVSFFGEQSIVRTARNEGIIVTVQNFQFQYMSVFVYYHPISGDCTIS